MITHFYSSKEYKQECDLNHSRLDYMIELGIYTLESITWNLRRRSSYAFSNPKAKKGIDV